MGRMADRARDLGHLSGRLLFQIRRRVPPGLRTVLGLLLMVGGVLGFLPILGFWMIPLGIAVIGLDVVPLWRAWQGHSDNHRRKRRRDFR